MPYLQQNDINPMILLTVFALLGALMVRNLPETLNIPLMDEIHDEPDIDDKIVSKNSNMDSTDEMNLNRLQ